MENEEARQNETEMDKFIELVKNTYLLKEAELKKIKEEFEFDFHSDDLSCDDVSSEIEAIMFNKKIPPSMKVIETAIKNISERINKNKPKINSQVQKIIENKNRKRMMAISGNTSVEIEEKLYYPENSKLETPTSYNEGDITIQFDEKDLEEVKMYSLIPKDDKENFDEYQIYFETIKTEILTEMGIKSGDPEINKTKFVMVVGFETTENTPKLNDVVLYNPSDGYKKYKFKADEACKEEDLHFGSGEILYLEGNVTGNGKELTIRTIKHGLNLTGYDIKDEDIKAFYQEYSPYLIYNICGPFTKKDDIDLTIFFRVLNSMAEDNPHLVIINGPFLHYENEIVKNGLYIKDKIEDAISYDVFFKDILDRIEKVFEKKRTTILITPSVNDEINYFPLPQPDYNTLMISLDKKNSLKEKFKEKMLFISNPKIVYINEMIFAVANYDIIKDITSNSIRGKKTPIEYSMEYILTQRSLYPILKNTIPFEENDNLDKVNVVDISQISKFYFNQLPDVILTTSVMNTMAKRFCNTLFVNPGMMYKGFSLGSFAKITIYPPDSKRGTNIIDRIKVDMCKIKEIKQKENQKKF